MRAELIARWVEISGKRAEVEAGKAQADQVRQAGAPPGGRQPRDKGIRKAASELGMPEQTVRCAVKVAGLSPEAKAAGRRAIEQEGQQLGLLAFVLPGVSLGSAQAACGTRLLSNSILDRIN